MYTQTYSPYVSLASSLNSYDTGQILRHSIFIPHSYPTSHLSFPLPFSPLLTPQNVLRLTLLNTSVVWLDELLSDLSTINKECVTLRALVTEDSGTIKCKIQLLSEFALWVCDEAELGSVSVVCPKGIFSPNAWKIFLYGRRKARCVRAI